jgi:rhodanese-related sulfurtransferase
MKKVLIICTLLVGGILAACKEQDNSADAKQTTAVIAAGKLIIVDVRSREEWINDGHADCTVNFPLDELHLHTDTLKNFNRIEVVCKSGGRAASAQELLESLGFTNVENMGSWNNVNCD